LRNNVFCYIRRQVIAYLAVASTNTNLFTFHYL